MKSNLVLYCFTCVIISVLLVELIPGADGKNGVSRRKDGRIFARDPGGELVFRRGDTIITSLVPNRFKLIMPYRWFYALNNHLVIHFLPKVHKIFKNVQPVLIDVPKKYKRAKMENRGKKPGHIGNVGALVAVLMYESSKQHGLKYKFDFLRCNCKHYVEYLSMGSAKGSWFKPLFLRMSKSCPLWAPLRKEMYFEIWKSKKFTLKDKKGKEIHLHVNEWPDYLDKTDP